MYNWKMYEIYFIPNFLPPCLQAFRSSLLVFPWFWSISEYEIKFHTKRFGRKRTKFFAYENFFFYSTQIVYEVVRDEKDCPRTSACHKRMARHSRYNRGVTFQCVLRKKKKKGKQNIISLRLRPAVCVLLSLFKKRGVNF